MFKLSFIILALLLTINVLAIQSPHGKMLSTKCDVCHTTGGWTKIKTGSFNHNQTGFPLAGQHQTVSCKKCHVDLVFSNAKKDCNACHTDVHQQTVGQDCKRCHTESSWIVPNIAQIHEQTRFPLRDSHKQVDCNQCHKSASLLRFDPMSSECVDCHLADYNSNQTHVSNNFSKECVLCHNGKNWESTTFDHNTTAFPLTGSHKDVDCKSCHEKGYSGTSTECVSCHLINFNASKKPNHIAAKFSTDCKTCHNVNGWSPAKFDHDVNTDFPLTGSHKGVDCIKCHANGYANTPSTCVSCHKPDFDGTTNPNHVANKFSTECQTCHNSTTWQPSTFNHNTTAFPLTGSHKGVDCIKCHTNGYVNTPSTCVSCHKPDFDGTTNPNHVANKFSTDCQTCHNSTTWQPSTFNHNTTAFPLTGSHKGVDCIKCHANGYVNTPSTCVSCHKPDFDGTTNPNHVANKFSTDCQTCHNSTTWQPSTFNHNTTAFPLTGSHKGVDCIKCHANGYVNTPSTCVSCHKTDFDGTTNPNHVTAKFSTDCQTCHNSTAWQPSTFNHNTNTSFPLTGSHIGVDCIKCHASGYSNTPSTCVSCHKTDFDGTTNPNHITTKFSTDCQTCHNSTAWQPSTFNHNTNTSFPLTGSHIGVDCIKCHASGYSNTSTTCVSCHKTDYNATKSPVHATSGFSTDCVSCHKTTTWIPSTFNHETYFPIKTGKHTGLACKECHNNAANYKVFACTNCHEHIKSSMDSEHRGISGYVWNSTNCYSCHPRGKG